MKYSKSANYTVRCVLGALMLIGGLSTAQRSAQTTPATAETGTRPDQLGGNAVATSPWEYSTLADEMRGTQTWFATTVSPTLLAFESPYDGGSTASLVLRSTGGQIEAILQVSKGQFFCSSSPGGAIAVRFDGGNIQIFTCSEPADSTSGLLFIHPADRFLAALKQSKKVLIEAPFYQAGSRQIPFDTSGLAWK